MNKKEIIILAAIGAGAYILSQVKAMKTYIAPQYAKTAAQKLAAYEAIFSRMPVARIRDMIAYAVAHKKTGDVLALLKAEEARRVAAYKAAVAQKRRIAKIRSAVRRPFLKLRRR